MVGFATPGLQKYQDVRHVEILDQLRPLHHQMESRRETVGKSRERLVRDQSETYREKVED